MAADKNTKRILVVMAHPDDETFGIGGTLAHYTRQGVEVDLICMTGGEAGTVDEKFLEHYDSIAELREAELRCAAQTLGLRKVIMGGYRDSGMDGSEDNKHPDSLASQSVESVAAKLVGTIRELRPDVVITHDPIGTYCHPDHIACQRATEIAVREAGDVVKHPEQGFAPYQPAKLYYHTIPKGWMRFLVRLMKLTGRDPSQFGRNKDIDLRTLAEEGNFPIHATIGIRDALAVRDAASACHASQLGGGPPNRGLVSWLMRLFAGKENYMRAFPPASKGLRERDLFEGI